MVNTKNCCCEEECLSQLTSQNMQRTDGRFFVTCSFLSKNIHESSRWCNVHVKGNKSHKNCSMTVMAHIDWKSEDWRRPIQVCQVYVSSFRRNSSGSLTEGHHRISEICCIFEGLGILTSNSDTMYHSSHIGSSVLSSLTVLSPGCRSDGTSFYCMTTGWELLPSFFILSKDYCYFCGFLPISVYKCSIVPASWAFLIFKKGIP